MKEIIMYTYVVGRIYRVICRDVGASGVSNKNINDMALNGSNTGTHGPLFYKDCYKYSVVIILDI